MFKIEKRDLIQCWVKFNREIFSEIVTSGEEDWRDVSDALGLSDDCDYNVIIDSFYLLEDTQLAIENYQKFGLTGATISAEGWREATLCSDRA